MNEEKITIDCKEWQEIMRDYDYQTKQANEYLLEAQKYACELAKVRKENKKLKEKLEASEKARKNCYEYLKNPPEDVWSGHSLEKAKELLDIDKGE